MEIILYFILFGIGFLIGTVSKEKPKPKQVFIPADLWEVLTELAAYRKATDGGDMEVLVETVGSLTSNYGAMADRLATLEGRMLDFFESLNEKKTKGEKK